MNAWIHAHTGDLKLFIYGCAITCVVIFTWMCVRYLRSNRGKHRGAPRPADPVYGDLTEHDTAWDRIDWDEPDDVGVMTMTGPMPKVTGDTYELAGRWEPLEPLPVQTVSLPPCMEDTCAHCGGPLQGYARVSDLPVCHTSTEGYPDCYRLVTVYGQPLGALRNPSPADMRQVVVSSLNPPDLPVLVLIDEAFDRAFWGEHHGQPGDPANLPTHAAGTGPQAAALAGASTARANRGSAVPVSVGGEPHPFKSRLVAAMKAGLVPGDEAFDRAFWGDHYGQPGEPGDIDLPEPVSSPDRLRDRLGEPDLPAPDAVQVRAGDHRGRKLRKSWARLPGRHPDLPVTVRTVSPAPAPSAGLPDGDGEPTEDTVLDHPPLWLQSEFAGQAAVVQAAEAEIRAVCAGWQKELAAWARELEGAPA